MARYNGYARPKDSAKTMKRLLHYMGIYKWSVLLVGCWSVSAALRIFSAPICSSR